MGSSVAAITSADELLLVDAAKMTSSPVLYFDHVPSGLTSLCTSDNGRVLYCAGTSGAVGCFDVRSSSRTGGFAIGESNVYLRKTG